jgi:DNA-binding SARP family transcriptional activator
VSSHVSRLRSRIDPDRTGRRGVRLTSRGDGYLIEVDPERIDAHRFRSLVTAADALVDPAERSLVLREALGLWRGALLADVASDRLRDRIGASLEELRLAALETAFDADLACGRHAYATVKLAELVEANPYRARFVSLLMLALYRSGRQTDALAVYQRARGRLAEEFGLDPSPDVQSLHEAILRCDENLDLADRRMLILLEHAW